MSQSVSESVSKIRTYRAAYAAKNLERRKSMNNENEIFPCDLLQDPLNCKRFSNG